MRYILVFIISMIIWYLVGAFITNSWNVFNWLDVSRFILLIFSTITTASICAFDIDNKYVNND